MASLFKLTVWYSGLVEYTHLVFWLSVVRGNRIRVACRVCYVLLFRYIELCILLCSVSIK